MLTKLDEELIGVLACPLCKGDLERSPERFHCRACGLVFPRQDVRINETGLEGIFDFRIHRPEYCMPADYRLWAKGQDEYERWSRQRRGSGSIDEYLDEIESVREVYTEEYHISGSVLDVGGHQGRLRHYLEDDVSLYVSVDPYITVFENIENEPSLIQAYPCLTEPCNFLAAHAEYLPFKARSFDWIHMRSVLDHFADPYLALREAFRCCKASGRLLIGLALLEEAQVRGERCPGHDGPKRGVWQRALTKLRREGGRGFIKAIFVRLRGGGRDHHTFRLNHGELRDLLERTGWRIGKEHWQKPPRDFCIYISGTAGKAPISDRSLSLAGNRSADDQSVGAL